jgi:6-phosphogluconolactonase
MTRELVVLDNFAREAAERIAAFDPRTIVLTGGDTPRQVYEHLSASELSWPEIDVFFGDERCVPPGDAGSNYGMAHIALLSHVNPKVHRMHGESCEPQQYEDELTSVFGPGVPKFDVVLHGLGEDGHTASLFPGDPALDVTDRRVVRVKRPDHTRLTLTLPVLCSARAGIFLVAGEEKRGILQRLLNDDDIPAARITADRLYVFADKAAAAP